MALPLGSPAMQIASLSTQDAPWATRHTGWLLTTDSACPGVARAYRGASWQRGPGEGENRVTK